MFTYLANQIMSFHNLQVSSFGKQSMTCGASTGHEWGNL